VCVCMCVYVCVCVCMCVCVCVCLRACVNTTFELVQARVLRCTTLFHIHGALLMLT